MLSCKIAGLDSGTSLQNKCRHLRRDYDLFGCEQRHCIWPSGHALRIKLQQPYGFDLQRGHLSGPHLQGINGALGEDHAATLHGIEGQFQQYDTMR